MTREAIVLRPAAEGDRAALESFACSRGAWYEQDVERYVRGRALDDAFRVPGYALFVAEQGERLLGCMAYMPEMLEVEEQHLIAAARLHVLAIASTDQGRVLDSGRRLSDALLQTLIAKATPTSIEGVLTAVVARENVRSIRLCERNGLSVQIAYDARHVRVVRRFGSGAFALD